jgi:hypothetical protein
VSTIMAERTARKEHRCNRCRQRIRRGDRYREFRIPPGGQWSDIGNAHWLQERVHLTYAECGYPCEIRCALALNERIETLCCVCEAPEPGAGS